MDDDDSFFVRQLGDVAQRFGRPMSAYAVVDGSLIDAECAAVD